MSKSQGKGQQKFSLVLLVLVLVVGAFLLLVNFITDWMWFKEVGYVSVFFTQLFTELKFGIPMFIILALFINLYLRLLKRGYFKKITSHEATDLKKLNRITWLISIVSSAIASFYAISLLWFNILQFVNSSDFGINDPMFNLDISFYVFRLEFLKQLNEMLIGAVVLVVIITVVYYTVLLTMHSPDVFQQDAEEPESDGSDEEERYTGGESPFQGMGGDFGKVFGNFGRKQRSHHRPQQRPRHKQLDDNNFRQLLNIASGQISVLGIILFVMIAINFLLKQFDLLHAHTGAVYGAGFTDVNITLWIYRILMVMALIGAITVTHHIRKREVRKIFRIPALMIVVGVIGVGASMLVQNFIVSPDEINKESKYLERNIEYTQYAYDLNDVSIQSFAADNKLTAADLSENTETIKNIRINDYEPVNTFYNQTQSIRKYYQFNDVDVDRYMVNGKYTQTYLGTREIDETKIQDTWLNRHLKYTHGYGVALSRVDTVTASGQPDVMIGNIPPESNINEIQIKRPEIYFGELSNDYIMVNTSEDEFDYPDGDANKYAQYEGNAGIKLTLMNKLLFSIREGSMKILVSSNLKSDSKIIINRNVMERVRKIMPRLSYENDPYTVVADGKIYWMVDAYTTSSYYPYSEPYSGEMGGINYIRNSVKVVVDAYNGDVNFYLVDDKDPIANTFQKIYPDLFKSIDKMPEELRSHIRYPNTLFNIQAGVYGRYHMNDVKVFYQNEDAWDIADEIYGTEQKKMTSNYYIVKLPGEQSAEFINSIPFTPQQKQNMTGLMVARNDGDNYGKLVLYTMPKSKTVYGPMQIEAQINQNTEISKDFSLWSSQGTTYKRGNLFVIPIESSLLYVEPIYLEAANSAIPEVKRVIVAYNDKIAYEPTLGQALASLFGEDTSSDITDDENGGTDEPTSAADWIKVANDAYDNAQDALKDGDWAAYGKYMDQLQEALKKLV